MGGSGSGKSEFAQWFRNALVIELDRFYQPISDIPKDAEGNYDFDRPESIDIQECAEVIQEIVDKGESTVPIYDMVKNERTGSEKIKRSLDTKYIIVEGIFSFYSPLQEMADLKIFLDTPTEARVARRMVRDVKRKGKSNLEIMADFINVEKNYLKYIEPMKKHADLIIPFSYNPVQFVK